MNLLVFLKKKDILLISPAVALGLMVAWLITNKLETLAQGRGNIKSVTLAVEPTQVKEAVSLPDPTADYSFIESTEVETPPAKISLPNLNLSGVLISGGRDFAIINGQVLGVGEDINGGVISRVTKEEVVISFGDRKIILAL